MADISQLAINNTTYDLKDATARSAISALGTPILFLGISSTAITDGGSEKPTIDGSVYSKTINKGDIVTYKQAEFVWDGTKWVEFGDLSGLGSLATKNSASTSYTPTGSVSTTIKPEGSVSAPSFTGIEGDVSVSGTATGTISASAPTSGQTATYTPVGTVGAPGTTTSKAMTGATATFNGTAKAPTATTSATKVSAVVSGETLTLTVDDADVTVNSYTPAGTITVSPTTADFVSTVTAPSFIGTGTMLTFAGSLFNSTGKFKPSGTVGTPTFTGSSKEYSGTFSGNGATITVS